MTLLALFIFGFIKGRFTGTRPMRSALQTALIGSVARRRRISDMRARFRDAVVQIL